MVETQFQLKKYVQANDSIAKFAARYPGSVLLHKLAAREYAIALLWLSQGNRLAMPETRLPWYSRFTGKQPLLDTQGFALKTLERVRFHDPDSPLADWALMQIIMHHINRGNEDEAAQHDKLLIFNRLRVLGPVDLDHLRQFQLRIKLWQVKAARSPKPVGQPDEVNRGKQVPIIPDTSFDDLAFGGEAGVKRFRLSARVPAPKKDRRS